jgi:hypothetical protein
MYLLIVYRFCLALPQVRLLIIICITHDIGTYFKKINTLKELIQRNKEHSAARPRSVPMLRIRIRIRIRRIRMFLGLLDLDPKPLVRGMDPDPKPLV